MQRRTFLQGTAASIVAARFGAAFAQDPGSSDNAPRAPTIIYNKSFRELKRAEIHVSRCDRGSVVQIRAATAAIAVLADLSSVVRYFQP